MPLPTRNRAPFLTTLLLLLLLALFAGAPAAAPDLDRRDESDGPAARPATAPAGEARDFSGKYLADGQGDNGGRYKAMVEITRRGEAYQVIWVLSPKETYAGVGLAEGDVLSVGWVMRGVPGVIVYHADGEKLVGRWAAGAGGKTYKETLSPVK
jgi:hypothetical protein